ncbi:MAG: colanic acid biosynthesis acetyltransferase WcaF [Fulvivirga sp.]
MNLNYPLIEYVYRLLWWLTWPFFRLSPRFFYGWRKFLLSIFGAKLGRGFKIFPSSEVTFPWKLVAGDNVTISWGVKIYNLGQIEIHDNVIISQHSHLCAGTHDYESAGFDLIKSKIIIESNVWVAADVFIGPNVKIAKGSIIGARSVVFRDTDANGIYIGNPAELIKYK